MKAPFIAFLIVVSAYLFAATFGEICFSVDGVRHALHLGKGRIYFTCGH